MAQPHVAYSGTRNGRRWTLPASLRALYDETDRRAPNRSTASDGTIGNAEHAARESDHNPNARGLVLAGDITDDDARGCDVDVLLVAIVARRDHRVKYVIRRRHIWRSYDKPGIPAWTAAPYTGPDPHDHHIHVSVLDALAALEDTSPWWQLPAPPPPPPGDDDMPTDPALVLAARETLVRTWYEELAYPLLGMTHPDPSGLEHWLNDLAAHPDDPWSVRTRFAGAVFARVAKP